MDHICTFFCCSYRIFRNICFDISQFQVVACIEHSAVCISTSLNQDCLRVSSAAATNIFGPSKCFASNVSEISGPKFPRYTTECVTSCFLDIFQSLYHVDLALYDTDRTFIDILLSPYFSVYAFIRASLLLTDRLSGKQSLLTATTPIFNSGMLFIV